MGRLNVAWVLVALGGLSCSTPPGQNNGDPGADAGATSCDVTQCPAPTSACVKAACSAAGQCEQVPVGDGTRIAAQTAGDCKVSQCDGAGGIKSVADGTDVHD